MNEKKLPIAKLEKKRILFLQIGLICVLTLVLMAFEWKTYELTLPSFPNPDPVIVEEILPEILRLKKKSTTKPKPPIKTDYSKLIIIDNELDYEPIDNDVFMDEDSKNTDWFPEPYDGGDELIDEPDTPFIIVQYKPEFPGGEVALNRFLSRNIEYPIMAIETYIQGRVFLTFVVEKDGSITNVKILRGIGSGCDEEAVRVVQAMPKWTPGRQMNRNVRVIFTLQISFKLQ
jgi:protein TonB